MSSQSKQVIDAGSLSPQTWNRETVAADFSIPEAEFTPEVSAAISELLHEIRRLEDLVQQSQSRVEELLRKSEQDTLLPVLNRRALMREITRFVAFAERYGTPSSLLYLDIDGFKAVNDTYGHAAGDSVLTQFCESLTANIRSSDILARVGGDEFAIIFPAISAQQAREQGTRLSSRLGERPPVWNGVPVKVTFACGACDLIPGLMADAALAVADRDMYAAKRDHTTIAAARSA